MTADTRQGQLAILSFALGAFAIGVSEFAAMGLLPYYAAGLDVENHIAGHAVSAYAIGVVIGAPVLAILGAKLPRKTFLLWLIAGFAIANLLSAVAPDITTLILTRGLAGLPHGAFLGVAMLYAADLMPKGQRSAGVAKVLMGLTIANVIGVPAAGALGQAVGWRELGALKIRAGWLTLLVGAVGFGGVFAVYSYFSAAMIEAAQAPAWAIPVSLSAFGLGATIGNYISGRLASWSRMGGALVLLSGMVIASAAYALVMGNWPLMTLMVFLLGSTAGLVIPLQMRLMDVAGEAQTLAAALNHAAFNFANALGPFLAGIALSAGAGWAATGWVGAGLSMAGIAVLGLVWAEARRHDGSRPGLVPAE